MTEPLPQSWSRAEICEAFQISPKQIDRLIAAGTIGYYRAGRSKRFLAEHVAQLRAAIEVQPREKRQLQGFPGQSAASIARRRSRAAS